MIKELWTQSIVHGEVGDDEGRRTIRCLVSNRSFSELALSYSPFSRCRWSGLSLESVGGSFSWTIGKNGASVSELAERSTEIASWICQWCTLRFGVSSFRVIANDDKLYRVGLVGGSCFSHSRVDSALEFTPSLVTLQYKLSSHFPLRVATLVPPISSTTPWTLHRTIS